jgi:hypothetical protein
MTKQSQYKNIEEQDLVSLDGILEILKNKKKLFWLNFKAGFVRGFAGVIGAAIAIVLIGSIVAKLGGIPIIGEFLKQIGDAVKTSK